MDSTSFHAMPVSLPEGDPDQEATAPGELLAVAHATFMAAALAEALSDSPASEIVVDAVCVFTGPFPRRELTALDFHVSGHVPGLDGAGLRRAAEHARSRSLRSVAVREDLPGELQVELY